MPCMRFWKNPSARHFIIKLKHYKHQYSMFNKMKRKLVALGTVLIVVGVISVSVSRLSVEREAESFQGVTDSTGHFFSNHIELHLEGGEKYRLLWYGTLTGYDPQNPTLEVTDPNGNTLYSTDSFPPPNPIDFWGDLSGVYTIDFNVLKSEDCCYNIYRFVGTGETAYPHHISLSVGLLLVFSGTAVTVACAVMPSKKLEA